MDFAPLVPLWLSVLWASFITALLCTVAFEVTR